MAIAELVMPKLGESIMEATILKWHKKVGDYIKFDETVLDIATDKVDSEVPSTEQGILTEILFQVNDVVPIGAVIARIQTDDNQKAPETTLPESNIPASAPTINTEPAFIEPVAEPIAQVQIPVAVPEPSPEPVPYTPTIVAQEIPKAIGNRFYSPLVLNIANSEGISLSELERIPGTGNEGRVSKKDVLQYVADRKAGKVPVFQQPVYEQNIALVQPIVSGNTATPAASENIRFPKPTEYPAFIPEATKTPVAQPVQQPTTPAAAPVVTVQPEQVTPTPIEFTAPITALNPIITEAINLPIIVENSLNLVLSL